MDVQTSALKSVQIIQDLAARNVDNFQNSSISQAMNETKGCPMSDLPPAIKAIQDQFRPRFEAQDARMEALAAAAFKAQIDDAEVTHDVSAEEALALLAAEAKKYDLE